ncbi:MAG TPA: cytochrome c biogenesis protein CcdA [Vicinamibacterales bacterium]|nr:cytochrome c biogenesis protein CcdA [Vicinamibacterales bacterium]
MTELLTALGRTLDGAPAFALAGAFLWGVASILLSPCHLAGVPLIVAYTGRSASLSARRAAWLSTAFALGILVTVAVIGVVSVLAGRMLGAFGGITNYLVAALLLAVGLELLGAWPFRWSGLPRPETTRRGVAGAFLFGLAFGTALGPCTLAFLAPVMGITVQTAGSRPLFAAFLMLAYAAGHCGVLALAGAGGPLILGFLSRNERAVNVLRGACGVLVLAGGLYLVYAAP